MKMLKRIFLSIYRKPAQAILMFLIIFILGNVLFASIAIKQTSENVRLELRARVPSYATVRLTKTDTDEKVRKKIYSLYKELENDENVSKINKLELLVVKSFEARDENHLFYEPDYPYEINHYNFGVIERVEDSFFDYKMMEGRYYTQEELDSGARVIVLSDEERYIYSHYKDGHSEATKLEVGDKIVFKLFNYKIERKDTDTGFETRVVPDLDNLVEYEMEIIGVYETMDYKPMYKDCETVEWYITAEMPKKCYEEMYAWQTSALENHNDYDKQMYLDTGYNFYVDTPWIERIMMTTKGLDASKALGDGFLENPNYPKAYYAIDTANEDYRYIEAPLENLDALANVALWSSIVLIVVLLNLVSILFIRNRTKEIGILISMGERKLKVLGQFVGEILIVGLLATSCSMITGNYFGEIVSTKFMEIQIDADYEMQYQEENPDAVTQLDLLETYKVELDGAYIISIYGASAVLLALSSALPIVYILKMKPKNVLM